MRYYKIDISDSNGKKLFPGSLGGLGLTSLLPNGKTNPSALNVEYDIPVSMYAAPDGQALVRIWGLSLKDNSFNLNDAQVSVYGGMATGLPLANPKQAGLLVKGQVLQGYGNWIGTDQTVDLILSPSTGSVDEPLNITFNWMAGTPMAQAVTTTLKTAFPGIIPTVNISSKLVLPHDSSGYYHSLAEFSEMLREFSQSIIGGTYRGVDVAFDGSRIDVLDGTVQPTAKAISFQDLIGQPTWIEPQTIQIKTVMRADIRLGDSVSLPASLATTTQQTFIRFQDKTTFSGNYQVQRVHHYGNFRQPDAASWNTTFEMFPLPKAQ